MRKCAFIIYPLALAVVIGGILLAGVPLGRFVDLPSLGIGVILSLLFTLAVFSPAEIGRAFRTAMAGSGSDTAEIKKAFVFFSMLEKLVIVSSLIGALIGFITMFSYKDGLIGVGVAACLLTVFYGLLFLFFVTVPFKAALRKKTQG